MPHGYALRLDNGGESDTQVATMTSWQARDLRPMVTPDSYWTPADRGRNVRVSLPSRSLRNAVTTALPH